MICSLSTLAAGQTIHTSSEARSVAARFAPVLFQAIGEDARSDFITNFNFDGDWRGDNNWAHVEDTRFPLKAYVYFAVSETRTHLFIHYAVFHARDYKGGITNGRILSDIINEGVKRGGDLDPTGLAAEATVAHENDMEGCMVVAAKQGTDLTKARVVFVETVAHNRFLRYAAEDLSFDGVRPRLYVEPKGHGIRAAIESEKEQTNNMLRYSYEGRAGAPSQNTQNEGYDLLPLLTTIWPRARKGLNETFGARLDFGQVKIRVALANARTEGHAAKVGMIGSAFLGKVGGRNMARPPWGWFDSTERETVIGSWFFDPAATVKRHFKLGEEFSVAYTWQPFLGLGAVK